MFMTNIELVDAIKITQSAAYQAAKKYQDKLQNPAPVRMQGVYSHRPDDSVLQSVMYSQIMNDVFSVRDEQKGNGIGAIVAACNELDAWEKNEALKRSKNTDYTSRLNEKIETCRLLVGAVTPGFSVPAETIEAIRISFAEFADDDFSIAAIKAAFPQINVAPESNTGKLQKHLREVERIFYQVIEVAGAALPVTVYEIGANRRQNEIDTFIEYCESQNALFSEDDAEVLNTIAKKIPKLAVSAGVLSSKLGCADRFRFPTS